MIKVFLLLLLPTVSFSQLDTTFLARLKALDNADFLAKDTMAVPEDMLTQKIRQLRKERVGLTTETVLRIKIMEEQEKDKTRPKAYYDQLLEEMTTGHTAKLLDNCLTNLYRRTFTEKEIDDLMVFYKTSAGKKMDKEFILLMLQSIKDAEQLMKLATSKLEEGKKKER